MRLSRGAIGAAVRPGELGLDLSGDDLAGAPGVEDHIDPTSRRSPDGDLGVRALSAVEHRNEAFDHPRLVTIADRRPGIRIQAAAQVGAKRYSELGVRVDRGPFATVLDAAEECEINARGFGELRSTDGRILS